MVEAENSETDHEGEVSPLLADDRFYRALADRSRRRALWYLLETKESSMRQLAEVLCGWGVGSDVVDPEAYRRTRIELEHRHLPMLVEAGLASYDREEGTVRVADYSEAVRDLVERGIEAERR